MRRALIGLAVAAALAGLLYATTVSLAGAECEVCVVGEGGRVCRSVASATREQAASTALSNACSVLGRNVTERLACERREPASLVCRAESSAAAPGGDR